MTDETSKIDIDAEYEVDHDYEDPYAVLGDRLRELEAMGVAEPKVPMGIEELPEDVQNSEAFQKFVELYDWPSEQNAGDIRRGMNFSSDRAFWDAFMSRSNPDFLNNFRAWLEADPHQAPTKTNPFPASPALQRAYVVAPDFFATLREALLTANNDYELHSDGSDIMAVFRDHPDVARAAHLAYKLISRLLVASDSRHLFSGDSTVPDITDAEAYLRT